MEVMPRKRRGRGGPVDPENWDPAKAVCAYALEKQSGLFQLLCSCAFFSYYKCLPKAPHLVALSGGARSRAQGFSHALIRMALQGGQAEVVAARGGGEGGEARELRRAQLGLENRVD